MIEHCWPFPEYDAIQRDFPDLEIEPQCYASAKAIYAEIVHQEAQAIQGLLLLNSQLAEQDFYNRLIRQSFDLAQCQPSRHNWRTSSLERQGILIARWYRYLGWRRDRIPHQTERPE